MTGQPFWRKSAVELTESALAGQGRIAEIAGSCLGRIAKLEPLVKAWAWCDPTQVMEAAHEMDRCGAQLPLSGVMVGIKDIIDTADMPTAYGAELYRGHLPERDAYVVKRLREAGALIVGKTVTAEFAYASPGPTRNPHNRSRTPGGSSSGSAAAVAAGMVPIAISSQTGGSTIRPAAFCGIVGFKPTYGSIDCSGMKPLAPSSDTVGIHARTVSDIALILPTLSSMAPSSRQASLQPVRIAWFPGPHESEVSADGLDSLFLARKLLMENGFIVEPTVLSLDDMAILSETNRLIMAFEAARSLRTEYEEHRDALTAPSLELIKAGNAISVASYRGALAFAARCRKAMVESMAGFDLLMTFSAPGAAPLVTAGTGSSVFNRAWSTLGVPCLNLPCGRSHGLRLPLGAQFVALPGQDARLLEIGRYIEHLFMPLNVFMGEGRTLAR